MISDVPHSSKKRTPKRNDFGAISEKFMRQIEKVLTRIFLRFWREFPLIFSS